MPVHDQTGARSAADVLAGLPASKQRVAAQRREWLGRWWTSLQATRRGEQVATTRRLISIIREETGGRVQISMSTLYGWDRRYRARGLLGLVDGRGGVVGRRVKGFVQLKTGLAKPLGDQLRVLQALGLAYPRSMATGRRGRVWFVWRPLVSGVGVMTPARLAESLAAWLVAPFARECGAALSRLADHLDGDGKQVGNGSQA